MNKKILSLAIAAAVAAPMAAQADVKISGSVARDMYNETNKNLVGGDSGTSKLNIDASEGDAFLRMAWDVRQNYGNTTDLDGTNGSAAGLVPLVQREQYAGVKVGGAKVFLGRQSNNYAETVFGADSMNATFLEARGMVGGISKDASFISGMLGVEMKAGDVSFGVQYGPAYNDMSGGLQKNPANANVGFKAGPVDLNIGYTMTTGDKTSTALRAKMKFGGVNLAVLAENADGTIAKGNAGANTIVFADANMDLGGVTLGVGLGSNTTASTTFSRVSVVKKMGKAKLYGGVSNDANSRQRAGLGLRVDM